MARERVDYRTAMREQINSRHQPAGERGIKPAGTPGSAVHRSGAGVAHPQNKLAPGSAGKGTDSASSGAKGGPSPHPQNAVSAEEAGESAAFEHMEQSTGGEARESVPQGPRAVGPADEAIPHAGTGGQGRGGQGGGHQSEHPLNHLSPSAAGNGADGKGFSGGGAQKRGGHAQGKVLPVTKRGSGRGGARPTAPAKKAGAFLKALAGN